MSEQFPVAIRGVMAVGPREPTKRAARAKILVHRAVWPALLVLLATAVPAAEQPGPGLEEIDIG